MPENPTLWWKIVHLDPAILRGVVIAVVALLGTAGILVSDSLADNLITAWVAIMALVQALWTRAAVTANARVLVAVPDPVNAPGRVVPGEAVTTASDSRILSAAAQTPAA